MIKDLSTRYGKFVNGNAYDYIEPSYTLVCDYCQKEIPKFANFRDAVNYKKDNGWKSINTLGEWTDMCSHCRNEHNI